MPESKQHYLYLWRHKYVDPDTDKIAERTCFGITSNPTRRIQGYEGHVGHKVRFSALWSGPERLIRELESQIKAHSEGFRFVGTGNFKYEWITEEVPYEQLYDWINLTLVTGVDGVTETVNIETDIVL
jgi:hypothetical protein